MDCPNQANVRLFTKTGWVNVCAYVGIGDRITFHYTKIESIPVPTDSQFARDCREAYRKSPYYQRLKGSDTIPSTVGAVLPRVPGEDDA